jgi:hypothetical protein
MALRYLRNYFGCPAESALLPPRLRDWLLKSAMPVPPAGPMVVEQNETRLTVTFDSYKT